MRGGVEQSLIALRTKVSVRCEKPSTEQTRCDQATSVVLAKCSRVASKTKLHLTIRLFKEDLISVEAAHVIWGNGCNMLSRVRLSPLWL